MSRNKTEAFRLNKNAFDEVIGDPYGYEEKVGHYIVLNTRSSIRVVNNLGLGRSAINPAHPSSVDFFCDVEKTIMLGLTRYARGDKDEVPKLLRTFIATYISEEGEIFDSRERRDIEQIIGRLLMERHISPVSRYFRTIRRPSN